ncbi:MAG: tRNA pseudouridine(55) synthase TruB [Alphaproteobacteria bacterium]|nr:tRNA pseudouridine(55) synthase TruB [Alphaproteobacteria bacterium]
MAKRRRGRPVHGWLIIDKPKGITSNAVVGRLKALTGAAKVGHAGTLDPLATGVLPLALGEATKTVAYVMEGQKAYRFTLRWGEARATDDAEGEVTATSPVRPDRAAVEAVLADFTGDIMQVPPAYSAVKVGGRRAYALARADRPPDLPARPGWVAEITLVEMTDQDHAVFEVICGKGVYMRSLARDIARALGTVGHIADLRRLAVGPFLEAHAIPLAKLEALGHSPAVLEHLLPVETALDDIPALALTAAEVVRIRSGQPVAVLRAEDRRTIERLEDGALLCAMAAGKLVALTRLDGRQIHPFRVINQSDGANLDVDHC